MKWDQYLRPMELRAYWLHGTDQAYVYQLHHCFPQSVCGLDRSLYGPPDSWMAGYVSLSCSHYGVGLDKTAQPSCLVGWARVHQPSPLQTEDMFSVGQGFTLEVLPSRTAGARNDLDYSRFPLSQPPGLSYIWEGSSECVLLTDVSLMSPTDLRRQHLGLK